MSGIAKPDKGTCVHAWNGEAAIHARKSMDDAIEPNEAKHALLDKLIGIRAANPQSIEKARAERPSRQ